MEKWKKIFELAFEEWIGVHQAEMILQEMLEDWDSVSCLVQDNWDSCVCLVHRCAQ